MKKFLSLISTFSVCLPFFNNVISCSKSSQDFFSATMTTKGLNLLFKDFYNLKNVSPINFKYLKFNNGTWEHLGFQELLTILKVTYPNINENSSDFGKLTSNDRDFIETISKKYFKRSDSKNLDLTGLTFNVENIFINSIEINSIDDLQISTFWAVTIAKGWNQVAKCVLNFDINNAEDKFYDTSDILKIVNVVISNNKLNFDCNYDESEHKFKVTGLKSSELKSLSDTWEGKIKNAFPKSDTLWKNLSFKLGDDNKSFSFAGYDYILVN